MYRRLTRKYNKDKIIEIENKSVGIDNLPNGIFMNKRSNTLLTALFNKILDTGITYQSGIYL